MEINLNLATIQLQFSISGQEQESCQTRIDFGMVLPTQFELKHFLKMITALKHKEDKYKKPQHHQQKRNDSAPVRPSQNKENQKPIELTQTSSWHSPIRRNTQIGNISVEQMTSSLGSEPDHPTEALEEIFMPLHQLRIWNHKWWSHNDNHHPMIPIVTMYI